MGKSQPVSLETRNFPTKSSAIQYFRGMLNRYKLEERVTDTDTEDLRSLLKRHSEYEEKVGVGINYFEVDWAPDHKTRCFYIVRINGTKIDFSYVHCIKG